MDRLKKLFTENSKLLLTITILEVVLSIIVILAFVYSDSLSYADSQIFTALGIEKLLETMYSSTWWALILLLLALIALFSLTSIVYKKMEYLFLSIGGIIIMLILAVNLHNSMFDNLATLAIFIPIIIINVIAYNSQKKIISTTKKSVKKN